MKLLPYFGTSLAAGAFLLAGSLTVAQTLSAARNRNPRDAASGQSSGRQAQSGSAPGMAVNEQGSRGHNGMPAQSIAVDHAGGNGVRRSVDTPKSGVNPLYESKDKANLKLSAGTSSVQPYKDNKDMTIRKKLPGRMKSGSMAIAVDHAGGNGVRRMDGGHTGNGSPGMAVNEQGSSTAPVRRRH